MRKRIIGICLLVVVLSLVLFASAPAADGTGRGKVEKVRDMWVLHVEGAPYEMGFQQGALMKEQIREIYKIYLNEAVLKGWAKQYGLLRNPKLARNPRGTLLEKARIMEKRIAEEYLQEMRGVADGSGVPYEDVLIMTMHVDFFAILCSGFAAYGPMTTDGHIVHGRNLDWAHGGLTELDKFTTVVVYKPKTGRPFASVGYPGIIGVLTGINDKKVTTELNFSMAKEENDYDGVPALILMRQITQYSESVADARKMLTDAKRAAGYNIIVADGKDDTAELIEITAKTIGLVEPNNNYVRTTNHFTSKELAGRNMNTSFSSKNSESRYARLGDLLKANEGKVDVEQAIAMMHDAGVRQDGTVQTVVFAPRTLQFWVWSRNRAPGDFVEFSLSELLAQKFAPM